MLKARQTRAGADYTPAPADRSSEEFFGDCFRAFLRDCFNNDANLIAYTFSVTERAAENWIHGVSLPTAYRLWVMLQTQPEARHYLRLVVDNPPRHPETAAAQLRKSA